MQVRCISHFVIYGILIENFTKSKPMLKIFDLRTMNKFHRN
jgi:hypothetical protein